MNLARRQKLTWYSHVNSEIFRGIDSPFEATRYHSLVVERTSFPDALEIAAESEDREIMGLRHKEYSTFGVQFHPESILTQPGKTILANFLKLCSR